MDDERPIAPAKAAVLNAAVIYFVCVFAVGLACGPIRVLWIEPFLGPTLAVALETPLLLAAMWFAARKAPRWAGMNGGWPSYLAVGVLALLFQQTADLAVGFGLRGMNITAQLAYFTTPPGWIYGAALTAFCLMPLIRHARTARPAADSVKDTPRP